MVFKSFRFQIISRIVFVILNSFALFWAISPPMYVYTSIFLILVLVVQVILIFEFINKINLSLINFFYSINDKGSSQSYKPYTEETRNELAKYINKTKEQLIHSRIENQQQYIYLHSILNHVGTGVILLNKNGSIELFNKSAKELLHVPELKDINLLADIHPDLTQSITNLQPGKQHLLKLEVNKSELQLAINATEFRTKNKTIKIISLQNFKEELDSKEIESWQKLIRVLTHEIMNSITPITTLSMVIHRSLTHNNGKPRLLENISEDELNDVIQNAHLIEERSEGLLKFVQTYRSLTVKHVLNKDCIPIKTIFTKIQALFKSEIEKHTIEMHISVHPEQLEIWCDGALIEQVLINLVKNAIESVIGVFTPEISMNCYQISAKTYIQIIDNGPGISPEYLDEIFVPFYTSKPGGTGIGLSLSKQIVQLHKGQLTVKSEQNKQTIFTIVLPQKTPNNE